MVSSLDESVPSFFYPKLGGISVLKNEFDRSILILHLNRYKFMKLETLYIVGTSQ